MSDTPQARTSWHGHPPIRLPHDAHGVHRGATAPAAPARPTMQGLRQRLDVERRTALEGTDAGVRRQHGLGKLTARERLAELLDPGSFTEIGLFRRASGPDAATTAATDGVITGSGTVEGRRIFLYAQDFTVAGGSLGSVHAAKIHRVMDLALDNGAPLVALNDGAGARIQDGAMALDGYGGIFRRHVQASGVIPQISVVLGPCAGGAAYSPALTDITLMVRGTAQMYLTGPDVVERVTGERVSHDDLGGADVHGSGSGLAAVVCDDERTCLQDVRHLLGLLPANNLERPPAVAPASPPDEPRPRLAEVVPADPGRPYDMYDVVAELVDDGEFFELHAGWARNVVCGLGRIGGDVVGVVANQPLVLAGVLDGDASEKAARFVRFCDAFNIPLVTLVDVPGFLPGADQERAGIIRSGAKLLYAYCEATVPRVQVILRKAYGGAYIVMDSRSVGADVSLAWPTNEIAVMGADAAVGIVHRRELAAAGDDPRVRERLARAHSERLVHPWFAAERGLVDDVIDPATTRSAVASALALLATKRRFAVARKHGNVPL